MEFTQEQQVALYLINNLRSDGHTPTRSEIEAVCDATALQSLIDQCDLAFDANDNLVYAPYPRR